VGTCFPDYEPDQRQEIEMLDYQADAKKRLSI